MEELNKLYETKNRYEILKKKKKNMERRFSKLKQAYSKCNKEK